MNNEEKILGILERMESRLEALENGQAALEQGQANLQAEMHERFDTVDASFKETWKALSILESRI